MARSYTPLSTWINNAGTSHSQGQQPPGTDCNSCHAHNGDDLGGWRALSSCETCHDLNGRSHLGTTKSVATHDAHIGSEFVTNCADCHAHDGSVTPGTGVHGTGGVVNFGGPRMTTAFNYSDTFNTEANCNLAANGCHNNSGGAGRWNATTLSACADCHSGSKILGTLAGVYPPTSNEHTLHGNNNAYVTGESASTDDCADCHGTGADTGAHTDHVNGSATIATSGTSVKINTYDDPTNTCTNDCHLANVASKSWAGASTLVCTDCHSGTQFIGGDRTGTGGPNHLPQSGLHDEVPTVTGRARTTTSFLYSNETLTADCAHLPQRGADEPVDRAPGRDVRREHRRRTTCVLPEVLLQANVGFTDATTPRCAPSLAGCHTDQGSAGTPGAASGSTTRTRRRAGVRRVPRRLRAGRDGWTAGRRTPGRWCARAARRTRRAARAATHAA